MTKKAQKIKMSGGNWRLRFVQKFNCCIEAQMLLR